MKSIERWIPPVFIKVENRLSCYEALDKVYTIENYSDFIARVEHEVEDSLDYILVKSVKKHLYEVLFLQAIVELQLGQFEAP